jgi:hypothetical protein
MHRPRRSYLDAAERRVEIATLRRRGADGTRRRA